MHMQHSNTASASHPVTRKFGRPEGVSLLAATWRAPRSGGLRNSNVSGNRNTRMNRLCAANAPRQPIISIRNAPVKGMAPWPSACPAVAMPIARPAPLTNQVPDKRYQGGGDGAAAERSGEGKKANRIATAHRPAKRQHCPAGRRNAENHNAPDAVATGQVPHHDTAQSRAEETDRIDQGNIAAFPAKRFFQRQQVNRNAIDKLTHDNAKNRRRNDQNDPSVGRSALLFPLSQSCAYSVRGPPGANHSVSRSTSPSHRPYPLTPIPMPVTP